MANNPDLNKLMQGKTRCGNCGRILADSVNFYVSNSIVNKYTGRTSICKDCVFKILENNIEKTGDIQGAIYSLCRLLDIPFLKGIYESSMMEAVYDKQLTKMQNGLNIWKKYIKTINSLKNYKGYTFENGEIPVKQDEPITNNIVKQVKITEEDLEVKLRDKQNREDIIKIIGYDPFVNEKDEDKSYFYSRLIDMIDEDMQNDSMKLTSVISIIKAQKQVDKIDDAISELMKNPLTMIQKAGDIKLLTATKKELQKSILDTAKDNRISDLYSGTKTTGANTLSGIVKKLKELDLTESQVNLYDIQTSQGMLQVARLSNKAIVEQLNYAENEYADMVNWQRGKLDYFENEYKKVAEENRKLKVLCNVNNIDYKNDVFQDAMYENLEYSKEVEEKIKEDEKEFEEIVKSVLPMNTKEYAEEIIKKKEAEEKRKLKESIYGVGE